MQCGTAETLNIIFGEEHAGSITVVVNICNAGARSTASVVYWSDGSILGSTRFSEK
jgi:hypothetical protein